MNTKLALRSTVAWSITDNHMDVDYSCLVSNEMNAWQKWYKHNAAIEQVLSPFKWPFSRWTWVGWYQNASILDFIGAKGDGAGGNKWSYKTCKVPVKSSPPTNQYPVFYRRDALPVVQPTVSSKHWRPDITRLLCLTMLQSRTMAQQQKKSDEHSTNKKTHNDTIHTKIYDTWTH